MKHTNVRLNIAKKDKVDNFFTKYETIEKELVNYNNFFNGKIVYCNCDDPATSNFYKYFKNNFDSLELTKLVCSWFDENGGGLCEYYDGREYVRKLDFDGDFRNPKFDGLIDECDVIVTNPPFSLFRDFIKLMIKHKKKFIILGNLNSAKYKDVFPYIKSNEIFLGKSIRNGDTEFIAPDDFSYVGNYNKYRVGSDGTKYIRVTSVRWFTNVEFEGFNKFDLKLTKAYNPEYYPAYNNRPSAVNCDKVVDIPVDYYGEIGVPVTFIDKYDSDMFEIVGILKSPKIGNKEVYDRIIIKRK